MYNKKYSFIIPVKNGINYLPFAVSSILKQNYTDYELIISNDNSSDGTTDYLCMLSHSCVRLISPPHEMTVMKHFEWALSHARGEWIIFLGADDGIQPYFFQLADKLTAIAQQKSLRAITSRRAYFFWNGCQSIYGDTAVSYYAEDSICVRKSKIEMYKALLGMKDCGYFDLPQMYVTSLFHHSLVDEVLERQHGEFLTYMIPDANMAAISTSLEDEYLESSIPLSWIGTSPGRAKTPNQEAAKNQYNLHPRCGSYLLGVPELYYWGALLTVNDLRTKKDNCVITSKIFVSFMLAAALNAVCLRSDDKKLLGLEKLDEVIKINGCNHTIIRLLAFFLRHWKNPFHLVNRIFRRLKRYFRGTGSLQTSIKVNYYAEWCNEPDMTLEKACECVQNAIEGRFLFVENKGKNIK